MTSAAYTMLAARGLRLCWAGDDIFERGAVATAEDLLGLVVQCPSRLPATAGRGRGRSGPALSPVGPLVPLTDRRLLQLVSYLVDLPPVVPIDVPTREPAPAPEQLIVGDLVNYSGYGMCRVLELAERRIGALNVPMASIERVRDGLKLLAMRERLERIGRAADASTLTAPEVRTLPTRQLAPPSLVVARGPKPPPWTLRYVSRRHWMENEDGQHIVLDPPRTFDGLVTYVWANDGAWMTRFWVESVSVAAGAVDLGGLTFDVLKREMRELEQEAAANQEMPR